MLLSWAHRLTAKSSTDLYCKQLFMVSKLFGRFVAYFFVGMIMTACGTDPGESSTEPLAGADDWLSLLSQSTVESKAPGPIKFPADLNAHPDVRAESFVLHALLHSANEKTFSVQAQIERIALKQDMAEQSAWAYTDLMRASLTVGRQDTQTPVHRESISRLALGLAGSERNNLYVGDSQLQIKLQGACNAQYNFTGTTQDGLFVSVTWQLRECPFEQSLGALNQWSTSVVQVFGHVTEPVGRQEVTGQGWMMQRFGNVPLLGDAVVIDEARLVLDDQLLLDASRSRRRSGRGPETVVSVVRTLGPDTSSSATNVELQWIDEGGVSSAKSGASYPGQIRFVSKQQGMSLLLTPLVNLPEITDRLGTRWDGAVKVGGSHEGYGFISMSPLVSSGSK